MNKAAVAGEKVEQKTPEKRRALGRGLESLLPGPRVVRSAESGGGGSETGIPHSVRNDNASARNDGAFDLQGANLAAVQSSAAVAGPLLAKNARNGAPGGDEGGESSRAGAPAPHAADLRSDVPTQILAEVETISISAQAEGRIPGNIVAQIPIGDINKNPYQTRYRFEEDALRDLAYSIKESGVVQPVVVRPADEDGRYILVLGERRLRASKMAGKETIPAIVRRISEQQAAELTVVENLQREDLNCLEQAEAFRVLSKNFSLTQAQIAEKVGVSRESVSNYMRLLKLPQSVQEYLAEGGLGFSEAIVLLQVEDMQQLEKLAEMAYEKSMSVEQIRDAVMRLDGYDPKTGLAVDEKPKPKGGARWVDPNVRAAQSDLQRLLGMRVRIRDRKGKGKIVIEYATVDDYERVVGMLRGKGV
ncbi:MAG TPA: ParB/RepB/Spo0J family partition protein [Candidatus Sulfotelmatobacter sp.]